MTPDERRALILDFDGVLADTEPLHFRSWNRAFDELLGIRLDGGHQQLVGLTLAEIYRLWWVSAEPLTPEMQGRLLARKTECFFEQAADCLIPMPGSIDLVRAARRLGWYAAVVSRARRLRLHHTLDLLGLPFQFDLVLGEEDAVDPGGTRKNHARAAQVFGIRPAACLVIEDSAAGIEDACAAGIGRVIGLTTSLSPAALRAAGAHRVVEHLSAVIPLLEETP